MMRVYLSAHGNPYTLQDPFSLIADSYEVEADSVDACQVAVHWYINNYGIGAGNWTGGAVYDGNEQIGYISYNGRYWEKGSKYFKEA